MKKKITIIDYGAGNIVSIQNAIEYLGHKSIITNDHRIISESKILILPGVGSFYKSMKKLNNLKITDAIKKNIKSNGSKILGICLGMQLLADIGTEDKTIKGIGLIKGKVIRLENVTKNILPHIGFNLVKTNYSKGLFFGLKENMFFYFVHSYFLEIDSPSDFKFSYCNYGGKFISSFENQNIFGTQFHPEKSQKNGLIMLKNFIG